LTNIEITNEFLKSNGFVVCKKIIPKYKTEIAAKISKELYLKEHLKAVSSKELPEKFTLTNPFPKTNKEEMLDFMQSKGDLKLPTLHGSLTVESRLSDQFLEILKDEKTIDLLSKLLTSKKVYLHLCPSVRVIHPNFNFALVPPHNDISYNAHFRNKSKENISEKRNFLTIWIPLKSNYYIDGGLKVFSSQRSSEIKNKAKTFWIKDMSLKDSNSFVPEYEVGDVIIFEPDLIHGSASASDKAKDFRISMDCRVFGENTITPRHYMDLSTGERFEPGQGPCGYKENK
tara:strand:- start:14536 stop:15396 length:861 start_codon:yes stop_codon:yes gene_type:complete